MSAFSKIPRGDWDALFQLMNGPLKKKLGVPDNYIW